MRLEKSHQQYSMGRAMNPGSPETVEDNCFTMNDLVISPFCTSGNVFVERNQTIFVQVNGGKIGRCLIGS